ncbi:hypothetical protein [Absidia glauca]|uniref:Uncharacterized protein n=1 Tax=Absidia glauca TaxID=4829 RepID=A0A168NRR9_ABSGL|nr:hypothetical protein [Absidia glauca]
MGKKYGIRNYARLLRVAKRDRDVDLNNLKARQLGRDGISKPDSKKSKRRKRKRGSRWELDLDGTSRRKRRASPSYGDNDSDDSDNSSGTNDDEHGSSADEKSDFVIEFGSTPENHSTPSASTSNEASSAATRASSAQQPVPASTTERKLTPMEKLKMKMRAGLEKTIQSDETAKLQKKQERQLEGIEHYVKERNGLDALAPIVKSINPIQSTLPATTSTTRYRSPSSSRSPSPSRSEQMYATRTPENDRPAVIGPLNLLVAIDQDHSHHPVVIVDQGQDLPLRPAVVVDQGQDLPHHPIAIVAQGQDLPLRPAVVVAQDQDLPPRLAVAVDQDQDLPPRPAVAVDQGQDLPLRPAAIARQLHTEKRSANDLDPC